MAYCSRKQPVTTISVIDVHNINALVLLTTRHTLNVNCVHQNDHNQLNLFAPLVSR